MSDKRGNAQDETRIRQMESTGMQIDDAVRKKHEHKNADILNIITADGDGTKYLNDNGAYTAPDSGGSGDVEEAPINGKLYGRKDAGWAEVSGGYEIDIDKHNNDESAHKGAIKKANVIMLGGNQDYYLDGRGKYSIPPSLGADEVDKHNKDPKSHKDIRDKIEETDRFLGGRIDQANRFRKEGDDYLQKQIDEMDCSGNAIWLPDVTETGDLSWSKSAETEPPVTRNIMGRDGKDGRNGRDGTDTGRYETGKETLAGDWNGLPLYRITVLGRTHKTELLTTITIPNHIKPVNVVKIDGVLQTKMPIITHPINYTRSNAKGVVENSIGAYVLEAPMPTRSAVGIILGGTSPDMFKDCNVWVFIEFVK